MNQQQSNIQMNGQTNSKPVMRNRTMPISNSPQIDINQYQRSQTTNEGSGFFSNLWNKIKSTYGNEEEEYIDAHGFKAMRPKNKIPLRNQDKASKNEPKWEGPSTLGKASQYSPFGRMFL